MAGPHGRGRGAIAMSMARAIILASAFRSALALDPALELSQYAHKAWKVRDGFSNGSINAIAQTPDGYLWLGTDFGLSRFDGVRLGPWEPPGGQPLPSTQITTLF